MADIALALLQEHAACLQLEFPSLGDRWAGTWDWPEMPETWVVSLAWPLLAG